MARYRRIRRYGAPAIALHWAAALGIAFLFIHGLAMMRIEESERLRFLNLHRSVGCVVFVLILVRIYWRATHPPPRFRMPPVQEWVAHYVHLLIYGLLVANGCGGVIGWVASGDPVVFFGYEIRGEQQPSVGLARMCLLLGFATSRALLVVVALHALAAVKHHVIDRDRLLHRMWPGRTILLTIAEALPRRVPRRRRDREAASAREAAKFGERLARRRQGLVPFPRSTQSQTRARGHLKLPSDGIGR